MLMEKIVFFIFSLTIVTAIPASGNSTGNEGERENMKKLLNSQLSADELRIIEYKETEQPFTGEFDHFDKEGIYTCRRCGAPLYESTSKFDSGCGWPSFDDEIEGAVKRVTDSDGRRTEIICSNCDAHLGHVFTGEKFTIKDTRHCVNSISMRFVPAHGETGRAIFAGGCFWGVEYFFSKEAGVLSVISGYTGGDTSYPSYQQVSSGRTGHVEAVEVIYDPAVVSYESLTRLFFEIHDPTQANGQGPDLGDPYLSVIFYKNEDQRETAEKLISLLAENGYQVETELESAGPFWPAENYHQDYYEKKGGLPYCHGYVKRF